MIDRQRFSLAGMTAFTISAPPATGTEAIRKLDIFI